MSEITKIKLFLLVSVFCAYSSYAEPIKIPTNKSHVIPSKVREQVIEAAQELMVDQSVEGSEITENVRLQNPFTLEDETAIVESVAVTKEAKSEPQEIVYDTNSILTAIGNSLTKQVRGTLARGDVFYVQLQGGCLLKSGVTFPARIPQIPDQVFNVTLSDVTSNSFTLTLLGESLNISLNDNADRAVRYSE